METVLDLFIRQSIGDIVVQLQKDVPVALADLDQVLHLGMEGMMVDDAVLLIREDKRNLGVVVRDGDQGGVSKLDIDVFDGTGEFFRLLKPVLVFDQSPFVAGDLFHIGKGRTDDSVVEEVIGTD